MGNEFGGAVELEEWPTEILHPSEGDISDSLGVRTAVDLVAAANTDVDAGKPALN